MRNNKYIMKPYVGMRIKIALPTRWCQVHSDSPYCWLKGKVIEVKDDSIIIKAWSKRVGHIERMMCFKDKEKSCYNNIIKQL